MELVKKVLQGQKAACARLITLVENRGEGSAQALKSLHEHAQKSVIIGITGPPGAGKSTLTDKLVKGLSSKGHKIGVIAVDPTSPFTKGAILGDRIRMSDLNLDPNVFIRSMGTRGSLGGLSRGTAAASTILAAYGCEYVFIETVGVGQSEIDIVSMADTTVMVMVPGLGDDIQAIKAGVMEIGDVFAINKADKDGAKRTMREIQAMLDFKKDWAFKPPVSMVEAESGQGIDLLWDNIATHIDFMRSSGEFLRHRKEKNRNLVREIIRDEVEKQIEPLVNQIFEEYQENNKDPYFLAEEILAQRERR